MDKHAFRVGLISFVMCLMIATLLIWISGIFLRAGGYELKGRFSTVNGLLPGDDVRYRGYKVGRVFSIKPSPDHIEVSFRVRQGTNIPKNSKLRVLFDGLIGEKYMGVIPNTNEKSWYCRLEW